MGYKNYPRVGESCHLRYHMDKKIGSFLFLGAKHYNILSSKILRKGRSDMKSLGIIKIGWVKMSSMEIGQSNLALDNGQIWLGVDHRWVKCLDVVPFVVYKNLICNSIVHSNMLSC